MKELRFKFHRTLGGFLIILFFILLNFGIHCFRTYLFNNESRILTSNSNMDSVTVELNQRGGETDSWVKNDAEDQVGSLLYGAIYDFTITNEAQCTLYDWTVQLNIEQDCYLNNAWNGTVEIHQHVNSDEKVQTLDLMHYNVDEITLDYLCSGADLLIPLEAGDYVIYHPLEDSYETPIKSTKEFSAVVTIGFIFYTDQEDAMNLTDYVFKYYLNKRYFVSRESVIFMILFPLWLTFFIAFICTSHTSRKYEERLQEKEKAISETLDIFSSFVDAKDPYTKGHSERVARYSRMVAEKMDLPQQQVKDIYDAALMHDIGKCFIPDEVLKKPEELTEEEFEIIKTHTTKGGELLKRYSYLPNIYEGALYHHEHFDGQGYPEGLAGQDIPLSARIISICDYYDAMKTDRHYRKKLAKSVVLSQIEELSGSKFDPKIVEIFLQIIKEDNYPEL